jgi:hypothetical protein
MQRTHPSGGGGGPTPLKPQKDELVPVVNDHSENISLTQNDEFEEILSYRVLVVDEVGLVLQQIHILQQHDASSSQIVCLAVESP